MSLTQSPAITPSDIEQVTQLLGREPRGLAGIPVRDNKGVPVVIQVASLVAGKPFPTLFWLVDKRLNYAIDQLEAGGFIARLQAQIDASPELQASMKLDHQAHIHLRDQLMSEDIRTQIESLGFADVLSKRGIGGIENFQRIRCLHTYYGSHLVSANTVGQLLEAYWAEQGVTFPHLT